MAERQTPVSDASRPRHEPRDVRPRAVIAGGIVMTGTVALLVLLANLMFPQHVLDQSLHPPFPVPPEPRLQTDPAADMAAYQAQQTKWLESFGWTDRASGIAHIPVGQAMRQIARDGIPGWPSDQDGKK